MLAAERMAKIVEITNERAIVTVDELIARIGSSKATIRRDISRLDEGGVIKKTHGGVMSIAMSTATEPPLRIKRNLHLEEKKRIAAKAMTHVEDNDFIFLDSGTTLLEFAKLFDGVRPLTAVTYDILAAMELASHPAIDLMMLGGSLRKTYYSFFGFFAESMLRQITVKKAFISADSIDLQQGLMSYTTDDIAIKKLLVASAKQTIVLCDHSKFEAQSHIKICGLSDIDVVITGREIGREKLCRLQEAGIAVVTA